MSFGGLPPSVWGSDGADAFGGEEEEEEVEVEEVEGDDMYHQHYPPDDGYDELSVDRHTVIRQASDFLGSEVGPTYTSVAGDASTTFSHYNTEFGSAAVPAPYTRSPPSYSGSGSGVYHPSSPPSGHHPKPTSKSKSKSKSKSRSAKGGRRSSNLTTRLTADLRAKEHRLASNSKRIRAAQAGLVERQELLNRLQRGKAQRDNQMQVARKGMIAMAKIVRALAARTSRADPMATDELDQLGGMLTDALSPIPFLHPQALDEFLESLRAIAVTSSQPSSDAPPPPVAHVATHPPAPPPPLSTPPPTTSSQLYMSTSGGDVTPFHPDRPVSHAAPPSSSSLLSSSSSSSMAAVARGAPPPPPRPPPRPSDTTVQPTNDLPTPDDAGFNTSLGRLMTSGADGFSM